ncbi:MAG: 50S ribosomal protein L18e [Euryarchaeota archaeon]|nr:50S ribosomal protein L18e [Euryarchaeota archaeon]MDE1837855.1 50S ribosomal protein L18e [Euryarchaeota archaeon]
MVAEKKNNPELRKLIRTLAHHGRQKQIPLWVAAAEHLDRSRHARRPVNVGHLERIARPKEVVVVPTKLLAAGSLRKPLTVAALAYSPGAREKVLAAGGTALSLEELLLKHADAKGVRLIA